MKIKPTLAVLSSLFLSSLALAEPHTGLSIHVLNQQTGLPAENVGVSLEKKIGDRWVRLNQGKTNSSGQIDAFYPKDKNMEVGTYKIVFDVKKYYKNIGQKTFFEEIPIVYQVNIKNENIHIPLLISQYGYSTYKGN